MRKVLGPLCLTAALVSGWPLPASAQVRAIQPIVGPAIEAINASVRYRLIPSGTSLLLQKSEDGGTTFSTVGTFTSAGSFIAPDSVVIGAATTSGIRLEVDAFGQLAVQEGDDSAAASFTARTITASVGGYVLGTFGYISTPSNNVIQLSDFNVTNPFQIAFADWGTKVSAESVSVAAAGTLNLGAAPLGELTAVIATENTVCKIVLRGSSNAVVLEDDGDVGGGALCTVTKDNASTHNFYFDTNAYFYQNNSGGTRAVRLTLNGG